MKIKVLWSAKMKESESYLGEESEEGGTNSASTAAGVRTITMLPSRVRCSWLSEIKVQPACWATAAYTASTPRKPYWAASARAWSPRATSSATTVTFGSRPKVVANASTRTGSLRVRLIAPATSANTRFGTMMGSARVRSTSSSCRLVAWPASRRSNPLTHTLASTVYTASPTHGEHRGGERLALRGVRGRE